jgi:ketosteroid isomerase-like protein
MSPIRMSRVESAVRIVLRLNEAFNRHDVAGIMQLMSDDCVHESSQPSPGRIAYSGRNEVTGFWENYFRHLPDVHRDIEEVFGLGARCVMRWKIRTGKNKKSAAMRGVDLYRIKDGVISETLSYVKGTG